MIDPEQLGNVLFFIGILSLVFFAVELFTDRYLMALFDGGASVACLVFYARLGRGDEQ